MRKLVYLVAVTADGFIAGRDGGFDFFPTAGEHFAHLAREYPETFPGHLRGVLGIGGENRHFDSVVMGRATYEVGSRVGVTSPYPQLRQYVVSSTMTASLDPSVQLVRDDPSAFVRARKQEDGLDLWLCGGGRLAASLFGEIDELILKVNPVVLGAGKPLFEGNVSPTHLELKSHQAFEGGVAIHHYRVVR